MENGQKSIVSLNSGLDTKSSDMLVSVSEPKFQHNRQKFQGMYLPSSIRFEHDGWAAGNDVYQFDITEAFVEAGSFIVSKQFINKNPTYKLIVKDSNKKQVGYLYYNNTNSVKTYNMDSVAVTPATGPNPMLTGYINGKQFQLNYNSVAKTFENKTPISNKLTITTSLKADYTFEVIVKDDEATINLSFDGMQLPTEVLQNGDNVLGTFSTYSENVGSTWISDNYTFVLEDDGTFIISSDNLGTKVTRSLNIDNTGLVSGSFTIPLTFTDSPSVNLKEFYPFFSNVTASVISDTVNARALSSVGFNKWLFNIEDREHNSPSNNYNQDKLFRNIRAGHSDYNKQTVEHIIPIWFGITAKKGYTVDTTGLSVVTPAGVEYARANVNYAYDNSSGSSTRYSSGPTTTAHIILKATATKQRYSASLVKPNEIHVWEGTTDKALEYMANNGVGTMYRISVTYTRPVWKGSQATSTSSTTYSIDNSTTTSDLFTLNSDWGGFTDGADVSDMISSDNVNVRINSAKVYVISYTVPFDIRNSIFYNGYNFSVDVVNGKINPPASLKGLITSAPYNNSYYNGSLFNDDTCFWGRCCRGKVASNLYIASTSELTAGLTAAAFSVEQTTISDASKYVDLSSIYCHKIIQASCFDNLSIMIYLCAKETAQTMFYSTGSSDKYMPGHIMYGNKRQISNSDSNLYCYTINKTYTVSSIDTDYGLRLTVSGTPAKTLDDELFNYISSVNSSTDLTKLIAGNDFTSTVAAELIDTTAWVPGEWSGWVDISVNSTNDIDFFKDYKQTVILDIGNNKLDFVYLLQSQLPTTSVNSFTYDGYDISVLLSGTTVKDMLFTYSTEASYALSFYKPYIYSNDFQLQTLSLNKAKILQKSTGSILNVNFDTKQVTLQLYDAASDTFGPEQQCDEFWRDNNAFTLLSEYIRTAVVVLNGVYNTNKVTVDSLTASQLNITVNGEDTSVDLIKLFSPNQQAKMDFLYTRVNEQDLNSTQFAEVLSDNEMQFLKQQWDTTNETENFWWLNDIYILVLTKSKLLVRKKTDELTDWDGDKFIDVLSLDRATYINSSVLKYFCSSAYAGQTAKFITVYNEGDLIKLSIYDFLDSFGDLRSIPNEVVITVPLTKHKITTAGEILCVDNKSLHTYSSLVTDNFISQASWSATCIGSNLIIGCHYDSNLNQWAIVYHLNDDSFTIIQGYGFVGVDGSLTGGELPVKYFDVSKGFIGAVKPLNVLADTSHNISSLSELFTIKDIIVGTESQQWYISKNISAIVSHLTYNNGVFVAHTIPLNNNYSVAYDSASYCSTVFSDFDFKIKNLMDLLLESNDLWKSFMVVLGFPLIYFFDPKISVANYLQQTLGQAAYVHYNSTSIHQSVDLTAESDTRNYIDEDNSLDELRQKAIVESDEISFDRQSIKQTQSTSNPYSTLFTMFAAAHVSALDWGMEHLQVNKNQNQSAVSDTGRKYSTAFMQNLNSMAIADMSLQSTNPAQTSEVTAIKTLDMFYSTSDEQKVQAGRGWVNHNFVAQCIAQSTTSTQSEFSQQKLLYVISSLTLFPIQQTNKVINNAIETCHASLEASAGPAFMLGGIANGGTYTLGLSLGQAALLASLLVARNATAIGLELVPQMLAALGGDKLNSTIVARQSVHNYDVEAKHRYGSKSECFMWPCFGIDTPQSIIDESVEVVTQNKSWNLSIPTKSPRTKLDFSQPDFVTATANNAVREEFNGNVPYFIAMIKGKQSKVTLPEKMAYVIGAESFLATSDFKNENIGMSEPVFPTPPFQDYIIDDFWQVSQTASVGMTTWISVKDTKIIDGEFSNAVISEDFCGIAAPYTAIEVKRGIQQRYLRPYAITSQALALNQTGFNCCFEEKAYHAFDGYGYRVVNWTGSAGMNKEHLTWLYSFLVNDRFKRSNKLPHNTYLGNFSGDPIVAINGDYNDKVFTLITQPGENKGLTAGTIGEDKDIRRYALPVFSEFVNTLPAAVKTVSAQVLSVIDGVTSLTTENRDLQTAYKAPLSVDFTIGKNKYRFTQEYICSLDQQSGITLVSELVPCLGLEFIGSTPYEAYLYSQATRQYYKFTGGSSLQLIDMIERFRNVVDGRYDFVNQEVLMPCIATFNRLDRNVTDDADETDNVIIPRIKDNGFVGEIWPPLDTIYNTRSWFKTISLPCGIVYQGPNRCIINRFTLQNFMVNQIKNNYGLWKRVPRETYHPFREYKAKYEVVDEYIGDSLKVKGWTHNPFLLVTAPLGISDETDCKFEWEITFCWPVEMDKLYDIDNYATVNIQAETMTPGGKVITERPTHVYLTKELFTRTGNYGYYSFRYQSNCGAGNRERLHVWSDQFICVSGIQVETVQVTTKRTEQLTQQLDVQLLKEI